MNRTISAIVSVARARNRAPEAEVVRVLEEPRCRLLRELAASDALLRRLGVDLVVDVGDVVHQRHLVARVTEPAPEPHAKYERPRVAHVNALVDSRAADIDPDRPRGRRELDLPAREGVVEPHSAIVSAAQPAPARAARAIASLRESAASTAASSGPRGAPVSASRSTCRSPPTAFSSRTSARASPWSIRSGAPVRSSTKRSRVGADSLDTSTGAGSGPGARSRAPRPTSARRAAPARARAEHPPSP